MNRGLLLLGAFLVALLVSPATAGTLDDIREGYLGGTLQMPPGELTIGNTQAWTKDGLLSSNVGYKRDPNEVDMPWRSVAITLRSGGTITPKSLSSHNKRNFISIIDQGKARWVPFAATRNPVIAQASPKTLSGLGVDEEIYGRFRFTKEPYPAEFRLSAKASLAFPLPGGQDFVEGYLLDGLGALRYYDGQTWKRLPWMDIARIDIASDASVPGEVPKFAYRMQGDHSDVWREWEFPK